MLTKLNKTQTNLPGLAEQTKQTTKANRVKLKRTEHTGTNLHIGHKHRRRRREV